METNDLKLNTNNKWQMELRLLTNGITITKGKYIYARYIIQYLCSIGNINCVLNDIKNNNFITDILTLVANNKMHCSVNLNVILVPSQLDTIHLHYLACEERCPCLQYGDVGFG